MTWQRRLAEMFLAGGAIAAVGACSTSSNGGVTFCCNANGDPCCEYKACGGPMTPACACQMDGGYWNTMGSVNDAGMYIATCDPPLVDSAAPDASEAGASDAKASD